MVDAPQIFSRHETAISAGGNLAQGNHHRSKSRSALRALRLARGDVALDGRHRTAGPGCLVAATKHFAWL
jgi:hypothetical protein